MYMHDEPGRFHGGVDCVSTFGGEGGNLAVYVSRFIDVFLPSPSKFKLFL